MGSIIPGRRFWPQWRSRGPAVLHQGNHKQWCRLLRFLLRHPNRRMEHGNRTTACAASRRWWSNTGAVSYLPPTGGYPQTNGGGFTVASEEPVYVLGNYNTGSADPFWPSENTTTTPHSAAAIIADTVTLLSNPPIQTVTSGWTDQESFLYPATAGMGLETQATIGWPLRRAKAYRGLRRVGPHPTMLAPMAVCTTSCAIWKTGGRDGATVNYARSMIEHVFRAIRHRHVQVLQLGIWRSHAKLFLRHANPKPEQFASRNADVPGRCDLKLLSPEFHSAVKPPYKAKRKGPDLRIGAFFYIIVYTV